MKEKSSEWIRRALRRQKRPNSGNVTTGDKVDYKKADTTEKKRTCKSHWTVWHYGICETWRSFGKRIQNKIKEMCRK